VSQPVITGSDRERDMVRLYALLVHTCRDYPDLLFLINMLPFVSLSVRKGIMTLCRVQQSPWENPRLYKTLEPIMSFRTTAYIRNRPREIAFVQDILPIILAYSHDPIILGFVSMILRVVPLAEQDEVYAALQDTIQKEVGSATGPDKSQVLDYSCLFSAESSDRHKPLHSFIPPRPQLAQEIHEALIAWKV
jgi:hypothetical protein